MNTEKSSVNTNRKFSQIDLGPTILEAIGIKIKNDALGLGRSVFSDEKTLLEKYDTKDLFDLMKKKSKFLKNLWYGPTNSSD